MSDPLEEKRRAPRRRVLKGAIVAYNDRHSTIPCVVRDISDVGARLRTDGVMNAPDTFLLIVELDGIEADCAVVWRRPPDLAVTFVGPSRKVTPKRRQVVAALVQGETPSLRRKPKPT
jgi:PilZ domain